MKHGPQLPQVRYVELYLSTSDVPALYDFFLDREGVFHAMEPPPPNAVPEMVQVVSEGSTINPAQAVAITKYADASEANLRLFIGCDRFFPNEE